MFDTGITSTCDREAISRGKWRFSGFNNLRLSECALRISFLIFPLFTLRKRYIFVVCQLPDSFRHPHPRELVLFVLIIEISLSSIKYLRFACTKGSWKQKPREFLPRLRKSCKNSDIRRWGPSPSLHRDSPVFRPPLLPRRRRRGWNAISKALNAASRLMPPLNRINELISGNA